MGCQLHPFSENEATSVVNMVKITIIYPYATQKAFSPSLYIRTMILQYQVNDLQPFEMEDLMQLRQINAFKACDFNVASLTQVSDSAVPEIAGAETADPFVEQLSRRSIYCKPGRKTQRSKQVKKNPKPSMKGQSSLSSDNFLLN